MAGLKFSSNLRRMSDSATLVSGAAKDSRGELALEVIKKLGLTADYVQTVDGSPTGGHE